MKMVQVPYKKGSLDSEDCFIMDIGTDIYIWQGNACNVKEKVKSGQFARALDNDRTGVQKKIVCSEGDDDDFMEVLAKGKLYKEKSDYVQLKAESDLG